MACTCQKTDASAPRSTIVGGSGAQVRSFISFDQSLGGIQAPLAPSTLTTTAAAPIGSSGANVDFVGGIIDFINGGVIPGAAAVGDLVETITGQNEREQNAARAAAEAERARLAALQRQREMVLMLAGGVVLYLVASKKGWI